MVPRLRQKWRKIFHYRRQWVPVVEKVSMKEDGIFWWRGKENKKGDEREKGDICDPGPSVKRAFLGRKPDRLENCIKYHAGGGLGLNWSKIN